MLNVWDAGRTIVVVGGGFSGTLFALAAAARPGLEVVLVERASAAGPGLAYGACDPCHVLNVPVSRMEVGLAPAFACWLAEGGQDVAEALEEACGELQRAFVPRRLFGAYLAAQLEAAVARARLKRVRGEVVRVEEKPRPGVLLADGRRIEGSAVVLATGNLPPKPPRCRDAWFYDTPRFVPDPWAWPEAAALPADAPLLLVGTGLTMVDVALRLAARGHGGRLLAVSRHGYLPATHLPPHAGRDGAALATQMIDPVTASSPVAALRALRAATAQAAAAGIAWQKVMDAARPSVAAVWSRWTRAEKARFLRHARTLWDVHRHRMAPRVAGGLDGLLASGRLAVAAGRITGFRDAGAATTVSIRRRGGGEIETFDAAFVVNCTGPRSDYGEIGVPLFESLRRAGRLVPDPLGLGIETRNCAVVDRFGHASDWLFALGPLTRPAWWEITAVPEISAQVQHLVEQLAASLARPRSEGGRRADRKGTAALLEDFVNLGEGI